MRAAATSQRTGDVRGFAFGDWVVMDIEPLWIVAKWGDCIRTIVL
jgi:hypothetical protein